MPHWLHATLQELLSGLLRILGYYTAVELELRILPDFHPRPDVASATFREQPYPTKPIEIVAEVLSASDEPGDVNEKCRNYQKCGIGRIFIFDPEEQTAKMWDADLEKLVEIENLQLPNGVIYPVGQIWTELISRMSS